MPANASIGPPALTLGAGVRLTGSPLNARRQPIPHSARGSFGCPISRGFVPWRLSDAGPGACGEAIVAGIRNPSHKPPPAPQKIGGTPPYVNAGNRCSFISELPAGPAVVPPINGSVGAVGRRPL